MVVPFKDSFRFPPSIQIFGDFFGNKFASKRILKISIPFRD